ncbi:MAG: hypothetical protein QE267_05475 [Akkermansiaceae bacterium]|nr:hypothetical protein [Akkermansiaceae bacterium]
MNTIETLRETVSLLSQGPIPSSGNMWGGAGVRILIHPPKPKEGQQWRSEPRDVITPRAREVSWLFERLRDAFYSEDRLDGCSKIEFFGRLSNAADRCVSQGHGDDAYLLCLAVLHEAFAIYEEMEAGRFEFLTIAPAGEIADDSAEDKFRSGYRNQEDTLRFFRQRGFEMV